MVLGIQTATVILCLVVQEERFAVWKLGEGLEAFAGNIQEFFFERTFEERAEKIKASLVVSYELVGIMIRYSLVCPRL